MPEIQDCPAGTEKVGQYASMQGRIAHCKEWKHQIAKLEKIHFVTLHAAIGDLYLCLQLVTPDMALMGIKSL